MATKLDFKSLNGEWVYRYSLNGKRIFTRSGMLYHALKQRVNPLGVKQKQSPLYVDCFSTFTCFQDFSEWCQVQVGYSEGFHLDKDLLIRGNKEYGKNTCVFLPQQVNKLLTKRGRFRGPLLIGVTMDRGSYRASCNSGVGVSRYLGNYRTQLEAFVAYKMFKEDYMKEVANKWKSQIDPRAYEALMNYEVLITD